MRSAELLVSGANTTRLTAITFRLQRTVVLTSARLSTHFVDDTSTNVEKAISRRNPLRGVVGSRRGLDTVGTEVVDNLIC